ncbi:hypothetical protein BDV95DRAFT_595854 [Massariosphaeria phaeospora]|uniref:Zn(2)-C6 fungal-type domain-containing protein n=1 Tax=Massariosphaeria phaeospora TaxID=100035 RepID=A0A7C8M6N4_9PLEO|nr:hypothetical protein BDV95DRAFT_595854 [Massariosphaeria phaeospora]
MAEQPERRRRRPALSCTLCRRRKIRCNRETPCNNCVRSKTEACFYETQRPGPPQQHVLPELRPNVNPISREDTTSISEISTASSHPFGAAQTSASTPASQPLLSDFESMKRRIQELEDQLTKGLPKEGVQTGVQSPETPSLSIKTTTSAISGTFHIQESRLVSKGQTVYASVMHKKRLFGRSHWIMGTAVFWDLFEMIEPLVRDETAKTSVILQKCKSLGRLIKSRREPPWPTPFSSELPPKHVADELVDCYLRTSEAVYRILHVPTFRRDYDTLWTSDTPIDTTFLVQLKLVLAIGATVYDEGFSLRASAIKWVYEAQTWFSEPEFKSRLTIQSLQNQLLLLLARESAGVGANLIWIDAGSLFRTAIHMGLHRDPANLPDRTMLAAEMRRRLWNTVVETMLQSSMTAGAPPLISLDDFDTSSPGNFHDEQLDTVQPVPELETEFTQISVAIALRKTLPIRLAVIKFLNNLSSNGTYDETLRLDAELRASYKTLCQTLQGCASRAEQPTSQFAIRVVDLIMRRYLSSIHIPFFGPALHETTYAFSRKVAVDTSLRIWYSVKPKPDIQSLPLNVASAPDLGDEDLVRMVNHGSGFFRTVPVQAIFIIIAELRSQIQEEENLGPVQPRPDLLAVVDDAKTWMLRCIELGEVNIKGYMFICMVKAQIDGLVRRATKEEIPGLLVNAAEEAEEVCLAVLERKVVEGQDQSVGLGLPELVDEWDLMMADTEFDTGGVLDPMSWLCNDGAVNELSM